MDESFYARLNLHKSTVVCYNDYLALHAVANFEFCVECIPWVRSELLETKGDAVLLVVEVKDNHIDLLVELNHLVRIINTTPREISDMDESVNTAKVNKHAV